MSLDKPQPVEALSTSYEFGLHRPPIQQSPEAERFGACAAKRPPELIPYRSRC
jgi:hypothetical protein